MKLYLDTSVVGVQIFGQYSDRDRNRAADTQKVYTRIDAGQLDALVSFYVLQELYALSEALVADTNLEMFTRDVLLEVLQHRIGLFRFLTREERLIHRRRFTMRDASDEPHVIAALLSGCNAILSYDTHFDDVHETIPAYTPAGLIDLLAQHE